MQNDSKLIKKLHRLSFTVEQNWVGFRLDKLFFFLQPQWTKVFIYKLIHNKDITINGKRNTQNYHLKLNDVVRYYGLPRQKLAETPISKKFPELKIIFEDEHVIVVDKPAKIAIQDDNKDKDSMNNRLLQHLKFDGNDWKPVFVHRLDTNTTGFLVGAKNYQTYCQLFAVFKDQKIKKEYLALVCGKVKFKEKEIKNYLTKHDNYVFVDKKAGSYSKFAQTNVKLIHQFKDTALLQINLITGRTHQIRVHLSHINHPICGDRKYSKHVLNKRFPYQALTCYKLTFFPEVCRKNLSGLKNQEFIIQEPWFLSEKYLKK